MLLDAPPPEAPEPVGPGAIVCVPQDVVHEVSLVGGVQPLGPGGRPASRDMKTSRAGGTAVVGGDGQRSRSRSPTTISDRDRWTVVSGRGSRARAPAASAAVEGLGHAEA